MSAQIMQILAFLKIEKEEYFDIIASTKGYNEKI
jgi:hypothetical protein